MAVNLGFLRFKPGHTHTGGLKYFIEPHYFHPGELYECICVDSIFFNAADFKVGVRYRCTGYDTLMGEDGDWSPLFGFKVGKYFRRVKFGRELSFI